MSYLKTASCNNATAMQSLDLKGNILPHSWYKKITTPSGKPDLTSIALLAEIVYWYKPGKDSNPKFKGDVWQTSYEHFEKRFGYGREGLRKKFIALEQLNIIKRELRTIEYRGHRYNNVLFLHLNKEELLKITNPEDKKISSKAVEIATPYPTKVGDHIEEEIKKENKEKSRSNESNFLEEIFKDEKSKPLLKTDIDSVSKIITATIPYLKGKSLLEFYPLTERDCEVLSIQSGREFNLNFMNQLLCKLASKYPTHQFQNKTAFINYMSKALENDLHQACRVNNSGFKMSSGIPEGSIDQSGIEKYLNEIENAITSTRDPILIFKRKIVGVLEQDKSYKFLKAFKDWNREGDIIKCRLRNLVELTDFDKQLVLEQAKSVFEQNTDIENIEFITDFNTMSFPCLNSKRTYTNKNVVLPSNIWGKVREGLIKEFGNGTDKSWFSKLNAEIDEKARSISLFAPTNFIRDWVKTNYYSYIERITERLGVKLIDLI